MHAEKAEVKWGVAAVRVIERVCASAVPLPSTATGAAKPEVREKWGVRLDLVIATSHERALLSPPLLGAVSVYSSTTTFLYLDTCRPIQHTNQIGAYFLGSCEVDDEYRGIGSVAIMGFDPDSGLVFKETIVDQHGNPFSRSSLKKCVGSKPVYCSPAEGTETLFSIAMRKILCNLEDLDIESLSGVPGILLEQIWKAIQRS